MDHERWKRNFNLDPKNLSAYHMTFNSEEMDVDGIVERILEGIE